MSKSLELYVLDEQKNADLFYGGYTGSLPEYRTATAEEVLDFLRAKVLDEKADE